VLAAKSRVLSAWCGDRSGQISDIRTEATAGEHYWSPTCLVTSILVNGDVQDARCDDVGRGVWRSPPVLRAGRVVLGAAHVARSTRDADGPIVAQSQTFFSRGSSARNDPILLFLELLGTATVLRHYRV
jgi:hypothetical protein